MSDLACTVSALALHPVKSCGIVPVDEALVVETGLDLDRAWMVLDADGEMLTQRECPRMALIQPTLRHGDVLLRAPGMLALHLALDRVEAPRRVRVWDDEVAAYDMGALAAQWFSDALQRPGLRLARFDPEFRRLCDRRWTGSAEAETAFADGFPILVANRASLDDLNTRLAAAGAAPVTMDRFRPNLVLDGLAAWEEDHVDTLSIATDEGPVVLKLVKPCSRCSMPDVDPVTAETGHAVGDALRAFRSDARVGGAVTFGMNAIVVEGLDRTLRRGQAVQAALAF